MTGELISAGLCHQVEDNPREVAVFGRQAKPHNLRLFNDVGIHEHPS